MCAPRRGRGDDGRDVARAHGNGAVELHDEPEGVFFTDQKYVIGRGLLCLEGSGLVSFNGANLTVQEDATAANVLSGRWSFSSASSQGQGLVLNEGEAELVDALIESQIDVWSSASAAKPMTVDGVIVRGDLVNREESHVVQAGPLEVSAGGALFNEGTYELLESLTLAGPWGCISRARAQFVRNGATSKTVSGPFMNEGTVTVEAC